MDSNLAEALTTQQPLEGELVKATNCRFIGCDNEARRSDGMCPRHSKFRPANKAAVEEAEEMLKAATPEAAQLALNAARVAALAGDHKPAAFILERGGAARTPAPAQPAVNVNGGLHVYVGRILPGLPGAEDE